MYLLTNYWLQYNALRIGLKTLLLLTFFLPKCACKWNLKSSIKWRRSSYCGRMTLQEFSISIGIPAFPLPLEIPTSMFCNLEFERDGLMAILWDMVIDSSIPAALIMFFSLTRKFLRARQYLNYLRLHKLKSVPKHVAFQVFPEMLCRGRCKFE